MPIKFDTYNIGNRRNGVLESELRGMSQAKMDLGIFQETKVAAIIYTCRSDGCIIVATDVPSQHRGGVAVFYRPAPHFAVEAIYQFGTNVVGFPMATGERRWYIMGCDLAPDYTSTIESVVAALKERPRGAKLLMA